MDTTIVPYYKDGMLTSFLVTLRFDLETLEQELLAMDNLHTKFELINMSFSILKPCWHLPRVVGWSCDLELLISVTECFSPTKLRACDLADTKFDICSLWHICWLISIVYLWAPWVDETRPTWRVFLDVYVYYYYSVIIVYMKFM